MILLWIVAILFLCAVISSAVVARAPFPPRTAPSPPPSPPPRVTVIIPARDESHNLPRLLASLREQSIPIEVIVVDGGGNGAISGASIVHEPPLPEGWVGKSWACWNGRKEARGQWLLFTDADTCYQPDAIARAVAEAQARRADLLTGLTRQELGTFAERVAMPPMFTLVQAATGGGGEESLSDPEHAVANGQFLLFRAEAYDRIGGHEAGRGTVVEDLALARVCARAGLASAFVSLDDLVRVRMYRDGREMFAGWRKNVAAGAARTPPLAFAMTGATFLAGLASAPVALLSIALGAWPAAALAGGAWLVMSARVRGAHHPSAGPRAWHAALHPLGYAFFAAVMSASAFDRASGRGALWKGRRYHKA